MHKEPSPHQARPRPPGLLPMVWPQVKGAPNFMPAMGRKPIGQPSQKSADEYDAGYRNRQSHARIRPPYPGTPMRAGWDAAETDQIALNAERAIAAKA